MLGKIFGRLEVVAPAGSAPAGALRWLCRCTCGTERTVVGSSLRSGNTKSCGCLVKDKSRATCLSRNTTHGQAVRGRVTPTYKAWINMHYRCGKDKDYTDIAVAASWDDYAVFLSDMGEKPRGMSIERLDSTKDYSKDNCKWATLKEQQNNKTSNLWFTPEGVRVSYEHRAGAKTLAQIAEDCGIPYGCLHQRITTYKMSLKEALSKPYNGK